MKRSIAKRFFRDVEDALEDYFDEYDCFWDTKTEIWEDEGWACITIIVDPESCPDEFLYERGYLDQIEYAIEPLEDDWDFEQQWDGNQLGLQIND